MRWSLFILVLLAIVVFVVLKRKGETTSGSSGNDGLPYALGEGLFTPAERSFLGVLDQAIGADFRVMGKVRVADVIDVAKGTPRAIWQRAFNRISAKHFDFVLCSTADLKPVCVIELNDQSHAKENRKDRDRFLDDVCATAGLPLVFFPAQRSYQLAEVRNSIVAAVNGNSVTVVTAPFGARVDTSVKSTNIDAADETTTLSCPRCASPMVKRTAKIGDNSGKEFWGCEKFPVCRGTVFP